MNGLERLIKAHRSLPWKGSHLLAQALEKTLEALQKIMQLNKAEEMRIIAAKATNEARELIKEK